MVCNVGKIDRIVRVLSAVVVIALTLLFIPTILPKIVLLVISVLLLLSAWYGVCYVYRIVGLSTAPEHKPQTN